jgi:DHA1 family bicyclomycin/chloramphenicol resistance-like MFS transporter
LKQSFEWIYDVPEVTKKGALVWILAGVMGITALSIDMSLPAMPQLQEVFGAGVGTVQLTLSLFLVGFAVGQVVSGPLSDRVGRRPVLLGGLALFTVAGLACAASPSLALLIAGRFVQGLGASVGPIMARAIIRDVFDEREASGVLSRITQVMIVAPLLAPTVGGVLLGAGWQWIFVVLGAAGLALLVVTWRGLAETLTRAPKTEARPALLRGYRTVLAHRVSLRHVLTICFSYAGMFAYVSGSPFVFIDGFGVSRQWFGVLFALPAAALLVSATMNRVLIQRMEAAVLLRRGVYLVLAGGVSIVLLNLAGVGGLASVIVPVMIYMLGMGLVQPNATAAAMAPHGRLAGVASSVIGSLQTAGGALSGWVVGAFYDHTPTSLALTVGAMGVATFLVHASARVGRHVAEREAAAPPLAAEA